MKIEIVKNLIREYLEQRRRVESLQEEIRGVQKELREMRDGFGQNSGLAAVLDKEGSLLEEVMGGRRRMERIEDFLFSYRSRDFIRSLISSVLDLGSEYGKDEHYHNLLASLVSIVIHSEDYQTGRRSYALREILHGKDEKVE